MKKSIKVTFDFDADSEEIGIKLIIDELCTIFPSVIGDGDVLIDEIYVEEIIE